MSKKGYRAKQGRAVLAFMIENELGAPFSLEWSCNQLAKHFGVSKSTMRRVLIYMDNEQLVTMFTRDMGEGLLQKHLYEVNWENQETKELRDSIVIESGLQAYLEGQNA